VRFWFFDLFHRHCVLGFINPPSAVDPGWHSVAVEGSVAPSFFFPPSPLYSSTSSKTPFRDGYPFTLMTPPSSVLVYFPPPSLSRTPAFGDFLFFGRLSQSPPPRSLVLYVTTNPCSLIFRVFDYPPTPFVGRLFGFCPEPLCRNAMSPAVTSLSSRSLPFFFVRCPS